MVGRPRKHLEDLDILEGEYVVEHVPLLDIHFDDEFNCRGEFSLDSVQDLVQSIRDDGLMVPVICSPREGLPRGRKYHLIAGHRRYRAVQLLGYDTIPAFIRNLTDHRAKIINLGENLKRSDLNILQEAKALQKIFPNGGSLREISKEIKQSERWVQARLRVLQFPDEVQKLLATCRVPQHMIGDLWSTFKTKGPEQCIADAKAIDQARNKHGLVQHARLPQHLRKSHRPPAPKIAEVMVTMLSAGIVGLGPRMGAYCAGYITQEELMEDIEAHESLHERVDRLEAEVFKDKKPKGNSRKKRKGNDRKK